MRFFRVYRCGLEPDEGAEAKHKADRWPNPMRHWTGRRAPRLIPFMSLPAEQDTGVKHGTTKYSRAQSVTSISMKGRSGDSRAAMMIAAPSA